MSRGLGKTQRFILVELCGDAGPGSVTCCRGGHQGRIRFAVSGGQ